MSLELSNCGEDAYFNPQTDGGTTEKSIEIFIENDFSMPKIKSKKKLKNEHRKSKKRKNEMSDESSDENLSIIKARHKMGTTVEKKKKKNKMMKDHRHKDRREQEDGIDNTGIKIKQEIQNDSNFIDESDEDVPLSLLEKDHVEEKPIKNRKMNKASKRKAEDKIQKPKVRKPYKKRIKNDNATECKECGKTFVTNLKFKAHMRKVHGEKPFVCVMCNKAFFKEKDLLNHHNTHTGLNPYSCGQCGKVFKSDSSLKKHIRIFHAENIKKYGCSMCDKVLSSAACLEEHERLHTGENPWSCNRCGKLFARERDLKLHSNLHEELFKCDVCEKCFITSFKLKEHYRSHTGETPYECDKCDRKFARLSDYRYHLGTHLGLKPFSCDLCGMKFTTSSSMKRHLINMHQQGPLDFKCHICTKAFHTQTRLNSHVKNHENKKRYSCHLCNATRSSHSELQRHLILHSGEFRCDTCNVNCSSAERLANHVAKHDLTGKPYACFVCSLGYTTSQTLNKHLATVHKNEDVPKVTPQHLCTLCGRVFDHKDKLNRHLKDDHIVLVVGEIHSLLDDQLYNKNVKQSDTTTHHDKSNNTLHHDVVKRKEEVGQDVASDVDGDDSCSEDHRGTGTEATSNMESARRPVSAPPTQSDSEGTSDADASHGEGSEPVTSSLHYSSSLGAERGAMSNKQNPVEVIQTLARRNIETFLHNKINSVDSAEDGEERTNTRGDINIETSRTSQSQTSTLCATESHSYSISVKKDLIISKENFEEKPSKNNTPTAGPVQLGCYGDVQTASTGDKPKQYTHPLVHHSTASLPDPLYARYVEQHPFKNIYDHTDVQSNFTAHQNSWVAANRTASKCDDTTRHYVNPNSETKQKHNMLAEVVPAQYGHVFDGKESALVPPLRTSSHQKHNYNDRKNSMGTSSMPYKSYFDELTQRHHHNSERKKSAYMVPTPNSSIHNFQPQLSHHGQGGTDHFNCYNPHAFASMADSSPHLFQNFRELQHRMLSSGFPGYSQHARQHSLSDVGGEPQYNPSSPLTYNPANAKPIPRTSYNELHAASSYHNNSVSDGDDKDEGGAAYELRVAAN